MKNLLTKFYDLYQKRPLVFRAPGRVNLIGEHTDYNDGFVMPAAIDFYTHVALAPRADQQLCIYSANFAESVTYPVPVQGTTQLRNAAALHWSDYPYGVAVSLAAAGYALRGADILIDGQVPIGSGLSSSAAIEVATGYALLVNAGAEIVPERLAQFCQQAENNWVGMKCGIMDQFISCCGRQDHALLLDCRSLATQLLPLAPEIKLIVCNTMVHHNLASSEYNQRRAECEAGVQQLAQVFPALRALRDVSSVDLAAHAHLLSPLVARRCRHVVSENERTQQGAAALQQGDFHTFGALMQASHYSLRDDYEVSCAELDLMVQFALQHDGVYGARMMGGGFGGCTINLVDAAVAESFTHYMRTQYEIATGFTPEIYICSAANGAEQVELT